MASNFFDKNIEDVSVTNPIVVTLSNFSAGGITSFVFFQLKNISIEGLALTPVPQYLTVNATAGSTNVTAANVVQTCIGHLRLKYQNDIVYYYEASKEEGDVISPIKLPAGTTVLTLTLKDQGGANISVPVNFQNVYWSARIVGL
jgi:hypothetical protein